MWWKSYTLSALIALSITMSQWLLVGAADGTGLLALFVAVVSLCGWFSGVRGALFATWIGTSTATLFSLVNGASQSLVPTQLERASTVLAIGIQCSLACAILRSSRVCQQCVANRTVAVPPAAALDTASLKTASALRATEKHFHRFASALPQVFWSSLPGGPPDYCNRQYYEAFGLSETTALTPAGLVLTIHPDDLKHYQSLLTAAMKSGQDGTLEYRLKLASGGGYRWHIGHFLAVRDEAGTVERWFQTSIDIEEQKRAELSRRLAYEELELRVGERTADLSRLNSALSAEIRVRKQAESARMTLQQRLSTAQEDERSRIARELHDQMGQYLTALDLGLRAIGESYPACAQVRSLRTMTESMSKEIHRLALELRPAGLDDFGLAVAVQNLLDDWARHAEIGIDYLAGDLGEYRIAPEIEIVAYRVIQEALTNSLRHAVAKRVSVVMGREGDELHLAVEDDGRGFDVERAMSAPVGARRLGILGMEERVTLIGGRFSIESTPGRGTAVIARLPTKLV